MEFSSAAASTHADVPFAIIDTSFVGLNELGVGPSPFERGAGSGLQAAANLETLRLSTPRGRRLPLGLPPGSHRVTVDLLAAQVDFVDSP